MHPLRAVPLLVATLFSVSCSTTLVREVPPEVTATPDEEAFFKPTAFGPVTEDWLENEGLDEAYRRNPGETIASLAALRNEKLTTETRAAIAELCTNHAQRIEKRDPVEAIGYFLAAAEITYPGVKADPSDRTVAVPYSFATGEAAKLLLDSGSNGPANYAVPGPWEEYRIRWNRKEKNLADPAYFDSLLMADQLKLAGLSPEERKISKGFGAPMIGWRDATEERRREDPFLSPVGRALPLAAISRFSDGGSTVSLSLIDLMLTHTTKFGGKEVELAGDFAAPIFLMRNRVPIKAIGFRGMLNPQATSRFSGLHAVEPVRKNKIPLVFVHGLGSDPTTWIQALEMVMTDPELREKYQAFVFIYPTGLPIIFDAHLLRNRLTQLREAHGVSSPKLRELVLVGHSLGGLLSSAQIRTSGDLLESVFFTKPLDEVEGLPPERKEIMEDIFYFDANPDVRRVVFFAAPHRGSDIASNWIGRLGAALVRIPTRMLPGGDLSGQVIDGLTGHGKEALHRPPNSIIQLEPRAPVLEAMLKMPISDRVTYHSIIGTADPEQPILQSTDLVVPYWSSSLKGASTEDVYHGTHVSINKEEEAMNRLRQILHEHLDGAE